MKVVPWVAYVQNPLNMQDGGCLTPKTDIEGVDFVSYNARNNIMASAVLDT